MTIAYIAEAQQVGERKLSEQYFQALAPVKNTLQAQTRFRR
jgi:hypothetical protein